jgi:hypothetical protein
MGIVVQWDNPEQTVVRWDFEPVWSWEELADSARVSNAMIASADTQVALILNASGSHPPTGRMSPYHRSAFDYMPSNIGVLIVVGGDDKRSLHFVMPFFPQMHLVDSLAEAHALLQAQPA